MSGERPASKLSGLFKSKRERLNIKDDLPFFSRLLLLRLPSTSSLSQGESFSTSSQLSCRLSPAGPRDEGRYSGVFFEDASGVLYCFGVERLLFSEATFWGRLILVKPELTAVKPPELVAVKPDETCGVLAAGVSDIWTSWSVSLWPFMVACSASVACLAGDSARRLKGVLTFDRFIGLWAGLGVRGPPYSSSSCW